MYNRVLMTGADGVIGRVLREELRGVYPEVRLSHRRPFGDARPGEEIILANLQVAYVVLHPRMMDLLDPELVRFKTILKRPISKMTLAQSITLTPGTITIDIEDDEFLVYAMTRSAAESLPGSSMERRIAAALEGGE